MLFMENPFQIIGIPSYQKIPTSDSHEVSTLRMTQAFVAEFVYSNVICL